MSERRLLKFGGSSVGTPERIRAIVSLVTDPELYPPGTVRGVVVSAFQGVTDSLIQIASSAAAKDVRYRELLSQLASRHHEAVQELVPAATRGAALATIKVMINELDELLSSVEILGECSNRTLDHVMSFGERLSAYIVAQAFTAAGYPAEVLDSRAHVLTNNTFGHALVDRPTTYQAIAKHFDAHPGFQIITGFIGSTPDGATTTLGRGGSDLSASLFGAALEVDQIEIWTDVDGMLTSDPRKVPKAFTIPEVTFEEAMELSHFGAKVIYPPTMQPAIDKHIPIAIKNTFRPLAAGTRIVEHHVDHPYPITGVSSISSLALLRLQGSGMVGVSGTAARFFKALAEGAINVILITQASSEHTICCAIDPRGVELAKKMVASEFALEIQAGLIDPLIIEEGLSSISVVGENMRNSPGVSGRVFSALGSNGVNVVAIAQGSSERNISAIINATDESKALNSIHDEFFTSRTKTINLWVVGTGLIGSTLLKQLSDQAHTLKETCGLELRLRAVSNSRRMKTYCNSSGRSEQSLPFDEPLAAESASASAAEFVSDCIKANLPNTIFVDCTASDELPSFYPRLLESSIAVVTPNKRGFSGSLEFYSMLRASAGSRRSPLLHETCVGAALPILGTLSDLVRSGDSVQSIEAVLSGTLSFIFNSMRDGVSFSQAVLDAKSRGYTEPDPRDDLSGMDVARKVLILARDAGVPLELEQIEITPILPAEAASWSVDEFMERLPSLDQHFATMIAKANSNDTRLFFGAQIDCDKLTARIGIQPVALNHPFCSLTGADNIVAFTTARYHSNPLVVKGPGAGAEVTAAGVFADIIRAAR
ncbi:MAG: bifunctional aspartate kinase/homoserine dehydrogenase I [Pseudomonadota bacterium]|jgi:aspartokinase/homoserine dehydrogenase 1